MRLFSALVPPAAVLDHLTDHLADQSARLPTGLRWTPADRWHVTLRFYGDGDDPVTRAAWLRERVEGRVAPRLRLTGGGTFAGVLWAGVHAATVVDERRFAELAEAAGADGTEFRAHLTLARWRASRQVPEKIAPTDFLLGYTGPWFVPEVALLMRSDFTAGDEGRREPIYTTVERLPLARA
ncbi:MAG TPA: 2'-5' RNA ligase family protein [Pseudonocardiaceae bacterium]